MKIFGNSLWRRISLRNNKDGGGSWKRPFSRKITVFDNCYWAKEQWKQVTGDGATNSVGFALFINVIPVIICLVSLFIIFIGNTDRHYHYKYSYHRGLFISYQLKFQLLALSLSSSMLCCYQCQYHDIILKREKSRSEIENSDSKKILPWVITAILFTLIIFTSRKHMNTKHTCRIIW